MKKILASVLIGGLLAGLASPVAARNDEVTVRFRTGVTAPFVKTLSQTFKAQAVQIDAQTWRFKVPPLKTQDQFSELFTSLPTVLETTPAPVYQIADHINPQAVNILPVPNVNPVRSQNYLPGELLVRFKPGTSLDDIRFLNSHNQVSEISRMSGSEVFRLRLPQDLSVEEAMALYQRSGIVQTAQPNYPMHLPNPMASPSAAPSPVPGSSPAPVASATPGNGIPNGTAVYTQIPLDGGGQMLINFRPQTPAASVALFHQIYGTRPVRQESFYEYRIQLPPGLNPARAVRIFMLYPYITNAQRLYS